MRDAGRLNLLALGDESAQHLGVDVRALESDGTFLVGSLVDRGRDREHDGAHRVRGADRAARHASNVMGPDTRVLPAGRQCSASGGGAGRVRPLSVACHRSAGCTREPPVGAVTALVGGPLFLAVLRRRGGRGGACRRRRLPTSPARRRALCETAPMTAPLPAYLGIDLGTTNSTAAVFDGTQVQSVRTSQGGTLTPSVVRIDARGNVTLQARARGASTSDPKNTRAEFKRLMGTSHTLRLSPVPRGSGEAAPGGARRRRSSRSIRADVKGPARLRTGVRGDIGPGAVRGRADRSDVGGGAHRGVRARGDDPGARGVGVDRRGVVGRARGRAAGSSTTSAAARSTRRCSRRRRVSSGSWGTMATISSGGATSTRRSWTGCSRTWKRREG